MSHEENKETTQPVDEAVEARYADDEAAPPADGKGTARISEEKTGDVSEEAELASADLALQLALEEAEQALGEAKDREMRAHAEMQNLRRRVEKDVQNAHRFALEKMVGDLLPVVDSLEKALDNLNPESEDTKASHEGLSMTLGLFRKALEKHGVESLNPEGEPFDPQFHEAMSMAPNPALEPNTVITVFEKGYVLNGRLVRSAKVIVSTKP